MTKVHEIPEMDETLEDVLRSLDASAPALCRPGKSLPERPERSSRLGPDPVLPPARPPWLAASLSILIWGGGQWLNGQRSLAILFLSLEALVGAVAYCLILTWDSWVRLGRLFLVEETTLGAVVLSAGSIVPLIGVAATVQAYRVASRRWHGRRFSAHPVVPASASFLVPGWGQIFNDQIGKAVIFLVSWTFGGYVILASRLRPDLWGVVDPTAALPGSSFSLGVVVVSLWAAVAWIIATYDALLTAQHMRQ